MGKKLITCNAILFAITAGFLPAPWAYAFESPCITDDGIVYEGYLWRPVVSCGFAYTKCCYAPIQGGYFAVVAASLLFFLALVLDIWITYLRLREEDRLDEQARRQRQRNATRHKQRRLRAQRDAERGGERQPLVGAGRA